MLLDEVKKFHFHSPKQKSNSIFYALFDLIIIAHTKRIIQSGQIVILQ